MREQYATPVSTLIVSLNSNGNYSQSTYLPFYSIILSRITIPRYCLAFEPLTKNLWPKPSWQYGAVVTRDHVSASCPVVSELGPPTKIIQSYGIVQPGHSDVIVSCSNRSRTLSNNNADVIRQLSVRLDFINRNFDPDPVVRRPIYPTLWDRQAR